MNYECLMRASLSDTPVFKSAFSTKDVQQKYGLKSIVRMAANENQFGPSPKAIQAIKNEAENAFLYPDKQQELTLALAQKYGVRPENILISNGATGVINSITETFIAPGDDVIMSSVPYHQYPIATKRNQGNIVSVPVHADLSQDLDGMLAAIGPKTKLIMVCNPGNPTSIAEKSETLKAFLRKVPENVLVMVDEAYLDFAPDAACKESMLTLLSSVSNLMVVRTFSKIYGLAGMRVGFCITNPGIIACMNKGSTVGSVNRLGLVAALAALGDPAHAKMVYEKNEEGRDYLTKALEGYGWKVYPSSTNFIYFDSGLDVEGLFQELLKKGIIIRNFALNRVSIGTMAQNENFVKALDEVLSENLVSVRSTAD